MLIRQGEPLEVRGGVCHSDPSLASRSLALRMPAVLGHEGVSLIGAWPNSKSSRSNGQPRNREV